MALEFFSEWRDLAVFPWNNLFLSKVRSSVIFWTSVGKLDDRSRESQHTRSEKTCQPPPLWQPDTLHLIHLELLLVLRRQLVLNSASLL